MSVGRICVRDVDTAEAHESVQVAAERMQERGVGTLVVLNAAQEPIGIVTDRDLTARVLARRRDATQTPLSEVMTPGPTTISEEATIESGLSLMRSGGFRRLPVVDRDGKLVGLLSLDDVLTLLAEEFNLIGQLLRRGTPARIP
ncbi:MAG: CBS domain-containing protein [Planctomycetia bacterium]|nr:CBS domain-containing protein [Planctomycetia bacterium]